MRVGFIGLGRMGGPMARNVRAAGFDLVVHDVRREAAAPLEALGATWVPAPRAAAEGVDVLVTMLPGPPEVEAVLFGRNGAFDGLASGSTWIDMSTTTPGVGDRAAELGSARGVSCLDAPVSGMTKGAESGTLQVFAGGERATFERVLPVLRAMGDPERIFHVGPKGAGYAVKLCLNLLWFMHAAAAAEVLVLGVRAGVELDTLRRALVASPANSNLIERDIDGLLARGDYDESFTLDLVTKDLGLAIDLGRATGTPLELSGLVEQLHRRARAVYGDRGGELLAFRLVEDATGTYLRHAPAAGPGDAAASAPGAAPGDTAAASAPARVVHRPGRAPGTGAATNTEET
jgi:3-hydroxyisobutyrate dehydrogenase